MNQLQYEGNFYDVNSNSRAIFRYRSKYTGDMQ
jgi:hypothetical protein